MKSRRSFLDWLCCTSKVNELVSDPDMLVNRSRGSIKIKNSTKKRNNSEIINSKIQSKEIKHLMQTPDNVDDINTYKYQCPICLIHFNYVLKTTCCGHYICMDDAHKIVMKQSQENRTLDCPQCKSTDCKFVDVDDTNSIRIYSDSFQQVINRFSEAQSVRENSLIDPRFIPIDMKVYEESVRRNATERLTYRNEPEEKNYKHNIKGVLKGNDNPFQVIGTDLNQDIKIHENEYNNNYNNNNQVRDDNDIEANYEEEKLDLNDILLEAKEISLDLIEKPRKEVYKNKICISFNNKLSNKENFGLNLNKRRKLWKSYVNPSPVHDEPKILLAESMILSHHKLDSILNNSVNLDFESEQNDFREFDKAAEISVPLVNDNVFNYNKIRINSRSTTSFIKNKNSGKKHQINEI